jgi:hypothetical protein
MRRVKIITNSRNTMKKFHEVMNGYNESEVQIINSQ